MPSAEVLDFAKLLAAIPGDKPAGTDLRADKSPVTDYHTIRGARKAASDTERRIDQGDDTDGSPDWRSVLERGTKVLAEKSKDLEITAYLIEALVRLHGFAGLRDGFRLARELVERFWDGLYPLPEDSDIETRFSHILWLNGIDKAGTLIVPVRKIPLTGQTSLGSFHLAHHQQALSLNKMTDAKLRQKKIDEGAVTLEMIQKAVSETPSKLYADLVDDLTQGREEFRRFGAALSEKSGYDPSSSELNGVLESCLDVVKDLARDKLPKAPVPSSTPPPSDGAQGQPPPPTAQVVDPGVIKDRNDALDRLVKIAHYFREHEPQSIIPFALEQVVNWGKMSLPELLAELIPEEGPRKGLFRQVGIKPPETKK